MEEVNEKDLTPKPGELLTPLPRVQGQSITMNFIAAMQEIINGEKVARVSWANDDYCLLKNGWLSIFTKGSLHTWSINDGDIEGQDWFVLKEKN